MKRRQFINYVLALTGLTFGFPTISRAVSTKGTIIKTGYSGFDKLTGGLRTGELCVIAGRPSMGQSAFLDGIVINNAVNINVSACVLRGDDCNTVRCFFDHDEDVDNTERWMNGEDLVFRQEVKKIDMKERLLSNYVKMKPWVFREKMGTSGVVASESVLDSAPIVYGDASNDIDELYKTIRQVRDRDGIKLFVIRDMSFPRHDSSQFYVRELSELARKLDIALVISTENKNRALEDRDDKRPIIADLEAQGLPYADKVVFMYRDYVYDGNSSARLKDGNELAEVLVALNRSGGVGMVNMKYVNYSAFEEFV